MSPRRTDVPATSASMRANAREADLDDGQVAQQLLDVGHGERLVDRQPGEALPVTQQDEGAECQGAGGRLDATGQQPVGDARELAVGEL